MSITNEPIMGRERRKKGTPTHQLHVPVSLETNATFKQWADEKGVGVGQLLDEVADELKLLREQVTHNGTAILRGELSLTLFNK